MTKKPYAETMHNLNKSNMPTEATVAISMDCWFIGKVQHFGSRSCLTYYASSVELSYATISRICWKGKCTTFLGQLIAIYGPVPMHSYNPYCCSSQGNRIHVFPENKETHNQLYNQDPLPWGWSHVIVPITLTYLRSNIEKLQIWQA